MSDFKLPTNSQHISIFGQNGSGKSVAALWHLAQKDFDNEIWIVFNPKQDKTINAIPGAQFLPLNKLPTKPGLYVYTFKPDQDDDAVTALLWAVYETENIGVYIDEGYMINPRDPALNALYTQGRSKEIPVITLSQRPSRISRFAVSEAAFYQVFYLVDKRDRDTIKGFIPNISLDDYMAPKNGQPRKLKQFNSIYYDTKQDSPLILTPVPDESQIIEMFRKKLIKENNKKSLAGLNFI